MNPIVSLLLFVVPAWLALKRDYQRGLCVALAMFALMSNRISIETGAFEFTFQRILLLVVVLYWAGWRASQGGAPLRIPFVRLILVWWVANVLSLIFTIDTERALKWFLSFSTEFVLFYIIVSTSLTNTESVLGAYRALCVSAGIIAVLGTIEYYYGFNPNAQWLGIIEPAKMDGDVVVTFQHRILFGYSMAMGFPLLLALAHSVKGRVKSVAMTIVVMLSIAACYYSGSRGPWFGAAIAGVVMYLLASARVRKSMRIFGYLTIFMIIARPGVRDTLVDLTMSTFDEDSYRGASYSYRKELWPVAINLAKTSPVRALFGHGGMSTEGMDLSDRFQFGGSTFLIGYSSWDNNYACDLVEFGYVGLGIEIIFYACILASLYRSLSRCPAAYRDMMAAVIAALVVYVFALTNVYMFSPQLKCMFLTLVTIGVRLPLLAGQSEPSRVAVATEEMVDHEQFVVAKPA